MKIKTKENHKKLYKSEFESKGKNVKEKSKNFPPKKIFFNEKILPQKSDENFLVNFI